jgi:hypothetical protein
VPNKISLQICENSPQSDEGKSCTVISRRIRSNRKLSISMLPMYMITRSNGQYFLLKCCKSPNSTARGIQYPKTKYARPGNMQSSKCYQHSKRGIHYRKHAKHVMLLEISVTSKWTLRTNIIRQKSPGNQN